MLPNPIILFALSAMPNTFACNLHNTVYKLHPIPTTPPTYPIFIPGADGPADPATLGYTLNHHALLFYGDVLGMRHLFTFEVNPHSSLMFMRHAQGGKNGTGFQDADTMFMERRNREGLMEFLSYATRPHSSFSHLGLIVPDIQAAQARMEAKGVNIVKRVGDAVDPNSSIPAALGFPDIMAFEEGIPGLRALGFYGNMIIADSDGNLLEVIQQN
ncbi:lactoylglutathione lyase protein [Rutstroemia sp. NJR-2017a WRK4]|nr:lactoylglutathione lyase protein [Rutstroemia sp. NJR-2017a WRK4]